MANEDGRDEGVGRQLLFWSIALGGTAFDLVTKSIVFSKVGPPPARTVPIVPHVLRAAHKSKHGCVCGASERTYPAVA